MAAIVINVAGSYDDKAIRKAQASLGKLSGAAGSTNAKFKTAMKGVGIASAVGAGAVAVVGKALWDMGKEAQESVSISRSTEAILKSTGAAAWTTSEQVSALADSISKKTGMDDEAVQSAQNLLLTFKNVKNEGEGQAAMFDRATQAAADLSATGFSSLDGSAKMLGKALNDPVKGVGALSRAGVQFTDQQKEQIKALTESGDLLGAQSVIMAEVESQVGGVAEAAASPFDKLNVMLGNFKEQIGTAVLPAISSIVDAVGPVLDTLAGPLAEIAGEIGTLISGVFAQLQPILPPLVQAISQIVSVLAGGFLQAISALIPAIVPLVTLISNLALQIAPILAPILAKIGETLGLLLQAVMPLLGPLADLVLNILKQAAPIIDLAVSVIQILVQALMPVFNAVSQLIPPLNQLITVLFAAIMPILQPLLPIIQLLADILGMILVKAVAVLMVALGGLIIAFSKLAPFILENVTKPVVSFFMDMVRGVLEGAQSLLGWVPGLGDKLNEAVAAFDGLSRGVTDGIQQAADTVASEGGKIGQSMVDQGIAAFGDPNAPQAAGSTFGSNIVAGLSSQTGAAYDSGSQLAQAAKQGFIDGGGGDVVFSRATINRYDAAQRSAANSTAARTVSNFTAPGGGGGGSSSKNDAADAADDTKKKAEDAARAAIDAGKQVVAAFRDSGKAFFDYVAGVRDQLASFGSVTSLQADANTAPTAQGIVKQMRERLAMVRTFGNRLKKLQKLGLNPASIQDIIAAGPEAGSQIAAALLEQGMSAIREVNTLQKQYTASAGQVGLVGAQAEYGMTAGEARGRVQTSFNVKTLTVNVGEGVSATDAAHIRRQVKAAVNEAMREANREAARAS